MIFIMVSDCFRAEPVIVSRPCDNTTAEPIDSWEWPVFVGSQTPILPAANSQRVADGWRQEGDSWGCDLARRGEYGGQVSPYSP